MVKQVEVTPVKEVEISRVTGKPKRARKDNGRKEAAAAATMTSQEWNEYQTEEWAKQWPKPEYMLEKRKTVYVSEGGEGAYFDKTYEIVTRWRADTKIQYRPHAKKPGSKSHVRYEAYATATTVGEALQLGSYPIDWCFDYEHGFIKVLGPVADDAIDPSKIEATTDVTEVEKCIARWYRRELAKKYGLDFKDLATDKGSGETTIMRAHRLVANRKAEGFLKVAVEEKRAISDEEVTTVLSTWAFAKNSNRQNVLPGGQDWVWSDTLGLIRDRTGDIHSTAPTLRYPSFTKIITQWLFDRIPPEVDSFKFTSLNLNCNYSAKRHRDGNNFGPSIIKAFGDFTGGELSVFPEDDKSIDLDNLPDDDKVKVDLKKNMAMFNGNSAHEVDDFKGSRFSVVYFTASCHAKADPSVVSKLKELCFPYPSDDEDPHALLPKPLGYGKKAAKAETNLKLRIWNASTLGQRSKRDGWAGASVAKSDSVEPVPVDPTPQKKKRRTAKA